MKFHTAQFVQSCDACQRTKPDRRAVQGLLAPLSLPTRKWQSISMDWVVGLPEETRNGVTYDAILVVTDRATKMSHLIPTNRHESAADTARLFLTNVFRLHGLPRSIHTDCDSRMTSAFWHEFCKGLGIKSRTTTAWHPQANGQAERANQTMKQLLRIAYSAGQSWFDALPYAEVAMNSAPIARSKFYAFFINYGFHPCVQADVFS